jgi:predicted transcriptional regulator
MESESSSGAHCVIGSKACRRSSEAPAATVGGDVDDGRHPPCRQARDIAARTGLSKPTVNAAVRRMEQDGLLAPTGMQAGRQGRVAT